MKCEKFKTELNAYSDGAAKQPGKEMLEKHLEGCPECAAQLRALKRIRLLLSSLDRQKAPADLESRVIAAIKNNNLSFNSLEYFFAAAKTTLAAAALLFGVIAAFSFFTPSLREGLDKDNVEAINNYVLKGNTFAKKSNISEAKIIEALLG